MRARPRRAVRWQLGQLADKEICFRARFADRLLELLSPFGRCGEYVAAAAELFKLSFLLAMRRPQARLLVSERLRLELERVRVINRSSGELRFKGSFPHLCCGEFADSTCKRLLALLCR
jgi:hypothetical protein